MNFIVVASKKDKAGMNIVENLKELNTNIEIKIIEEELITSENIDKNLSADFIIFASKHRSKVPTKTLSIHTIGNFNKAEFGGKHETICPSNALVFKHFFQILKEQNNSDYEVTMETTHHGPYIETPSIFIEIGSEESDWENKQAGKIIANTIEKAIKTFKQQKKKIAFGIGGPHYCPNFNNIQLGEEYSIAHLIPEYALPISKDIITQIIKKTTPKPSYVILDWKGLGGSNQKNRLLNLLESFDLNVVKSKQAKYSL
jgi:D-aminoacyl-tRNA deacylase